LNPNDVSIKSFKVYKSFNFTQADSGSSVFGLEGISGSLYAFELSSSPSRSFTKDTAPYSQSFYSEPLYYEIKRLYYTTSDQPFNSFGGNNTKKELRQLHNKFTLLTIPQEFVGEGIKPGSIQITDNSGPTTLDLRDDGNGNVYDYQYSSSFAAYSSGAFADTDTLTAEGSGSVIGNAFYQHGLVTITDTGSMYASCSLGDGADGFEVDFKSTMTLNEYEYTCLIGPNEFNFSKNISVTQDRSGSISIANVTSDISKFFPPGDNPGEGTGSFSSTYSATEYLIGEATHSDFSTYVTSVGLYNDSNQLLAIGKLAQPIKNDPELALGIVVRFDI
jgi:hypothetical protein